MSVTDESESWNPPTRHKRPEPQRYQWFDQWLVAKPGPMKSLVNSTIRFIEHHEQHTGARKRARREEDERNHTHRIEAIVCNLAHAVLLPPPHGRFAVPLGHGDKGRSRYSSPAIGKLLSRTLGLMQELGFLRLYEPGTIRGEVSSVMVSDWFARQVVESGATLQDFDRREDEEIILLARNTRKSDHRVRTMIDYTDTEETMRFRADLKKLNAFLKSAEIDFADDCLEPRINPFDRTLRRHFVIFANQKKRFDQSGRFFGGFWQNLKSARRHNIRIGGEPTVTLDYSAMFTRLAYADISAIPPSGDLYAIPGFEGYRNGIKLAMNCFLFDGGLRTNWPEELKIDGDATAYDNGKSIPRLPKDTSVSDAKAAILRVHPELERAWGRRLGYKLMFEESEIARSVLLELCGRKIPALGLHDGFIVPLSARDMAAQVMRNSARERSGLEFEISEKF